MNESMPNASPAEPRLRSPWMRRRPTTEIFLGRLLWAGLFAVVVWIGAS